MPKLVRFALILLTCLAYLTAFAQDTTITEAEFIARITESRQLIASQENGEVIGQRLRELWSDVGYVQSGDDLLPVDMSWLTQADLDHVPTRAALRRYTGALVEAFGVEGEGRVPGSLDSLRDILADPRFQYGQEEDEPAPQLPQFAPPSPDITGMVVVIGGVIIAAAVIFYLRRTLATQPRALSDDEDDEPKTSAEARAAANQRESERDYRNAIRYMFLALLLLLDERGLIHYDATLTNREHLRQVQVTANTRLSELLRPVVTTFDDVWYGFIPIDESGYRQFVQQVDQLKALVP